MWTFCQNAAAPPPNYCDAMTNDPSNFMVYFMPTLEEIGATCNKPYVTVENYEAMLRDDFLSYNRGTVSLMFMMQGASMGLNCETNTDFPDLMYSADMYGQRVLKATSEEVRSVTLRGYNNNNNTTLSNSSLSFGRLD